MKDLIRFETVYEVKFCDHNNLEKLLNQSIEYGWNIVNIIKIISMDGDCMVIREKDDIV